MLTIKFYVLCQYSVSFQCVHPSVWLISLILVECSVMLVYILLNESWRRKNVWINPCGDCLFSVWLQKQHTTMTTREREKEKSWRKAWIYTRKGCFLFILFFLAFFFFVSKLTLYLYLQLCLYSILSRNCSFYSSVLNLNSFVLC